MARVSPIVELTALAKLVMQVSGAPAVDAHCSTAVSRELLHEVNFDLAFSEGALAFANREASCFALNTDITVYESPDVPHGEFIVLPRWTGEGAEGASEPTEEVSEKERQLQATISTLEARLGQADHFQAFAEQELHRAWTKSVVLHDAAIAENREQLVELLESQVEHGERTIRELRTLADVLKQEREEKALLQAEFDALLAECAQLHAPGRVRYTTPTEG